MIQDLLQYYGMDWGALCFGLVGCYMITNKRREGFLLSMLGCVCGLTVAMMSGQYGFIVYNAVLIFMMARGYTGWRREPSAIALGAE